MYLNAVVIGLLTCLAQYALAVQSAPFPVQYTQPDNTTITLFIRGDEHYHWEEDANEFTVVSTEEQSGQMAYMYAQVDPWSNNLKASSVAVGSVPVESLPSLGIYPKQMPSETFITARRRASKRRVQRSTKRAVTPSTGTIKNLVIPIRFSDHKTRSLPTRDQLKALFNNDGPGPYCPSGSVKDVWKANSYGRLIVNSEVTNWIDVSYTEKAAAGGQSGMVTTLHNALRAALVQVDKTYDFRTFDGNKDKQIDMITFLHSGYAAEWGGVAGGASVPNRIWSHKWAISTWTSAEGVQVNNYDIEPALWGTSGNSIGRVGVIAHEKGHFLGLPDLYDTDNNGAGLGSWGLMANSWGFDGSQLRPPLLSAWSKIKLGYVVPKMITASGTFTAPPVATSPTIYKISTGFPSGEYLLIENRQPTSFDSDIRQGGLAIYHIDDAKTTYNIQGYPGQSGWPSNNNHYRVSLLQADGLYELEKLSNQRGNVGDLWRVGGKTVLGPNTVPNTKTYQGGIVKDTGITITVTGSSSSGITFKVNIASTRTTPATTTSGIRINRVTLDRVILGSVVRYRATVVLVNSANKVVSGATAYGNFAGTGWTDNGRGAKTGTTGSAVIYTSKSWPITTKRDTAVKFCITNIIHPSLKYTLGQTCAKVATTTSG